MATPQLQQFLKEKSNFSNCLQLAFKKAQFSHATTLFTCCISPSHIHKFSRKEQVSPKWCRLDQ